MELLYGLRMNALISTLRNSTQTPVPLDPIISKQRALPHRRTPVVLDSADVYISDKSFDDILPGMDVVDFMSKRRAGGALVFGVPIEPPFIKHLREVRAYEESGGNASIEEE